MIYYKITNTKCNNYRDLKTNVLSAKTHFIFLINTASLIVRYYLTATLNILSKSRNSRFTDFTT